MNKDSDIAKTLEGVTDKTLAEWWCFLNSFTGAFDSDYKPSIQVMNEIQSRIGHKPLNREWNKDRMTDEEHEAWYNKTFKVTK